MNPTRATTLLLADRSPALRWLVLRDLVADPDAAEVEELATTRSTDPVIADLVALQQDDGSWARGDGAWRGHGQPLMLTCMALTRLGTCGFDASFPAVERGAECLFRHQRGDGSWPMAGDDDLDGVTESPLQTAFPLRALVACGFGEDERAARAFEWLFERRLDDGAWPTGMMKGDFRRVAGYRRIAHSSLGCRTSTTVVLECLAGHPELATSELARTALDLLLGRDTMTHTPSVSTSLDCWVLTPWSASSVPGPVDIATILELCARTGISLEDQRVANLAGFVRDQQGEFGLWSHPTAPQCRRWLTWSLLRSLRALDDGTWVGLEPRTPFTPARPKRF